MSEQQFRGVAFGGFHRQDVLNYIESASREHGAALAGLRKELEEARRTGEALVSQREETERRAAEAEEHARRLSDNLNACAATLEATRRSLEEKEEKLARAEAQMERLQAELDKASPAAEAYESVKDRVAGVELDAHRRAQAVLEESRREAARVREELEQWMCKVQAGYDRLRTDIDATISHACGELDRVARSLTGVSEEFAEHDAALEALIRACRESLPQPSRPLSPDGE